MGGIADWINRRAERTPESIALIDSDTGERTDYRRMADNLARRAGALRARGIRRGDRVALVSCNSVALMETMFAVAHLGAVFVPVNYRLSAEEIAYILDDARPTVVAHDDDCAELTATAVRLAGSAPNSVADLDQLVTESAPVSEESVGADDVAMIMYTSGTTGHPKGAMLTHGNFIANAANLLTTGSGITATDIAVVAAPMFHIGALGLYGMPVLYVGGTTVIQKKFVPHRLLELISDYRVTLQFLVPAMWHALSRVPEFDTFDLTSLRALLCGGAPCPLPVIDFFQARGFTFLEGFGMTELSPTCSVLAPEFVRSHAGSVGRPAMHVDVRIVDEQDRDVATGRVGELVIRGDNVFKGYWGLPEATAEAKRGGWFHSGDLARRDSDGFITLVDRKKDMVVTGGENVYPIEVEQVLYRHPDVTDAAVIGLPDQEWGEAVTAFVVRRDGADTAAADLIAFCRDHIAAFKSPKRIEFLDELPRNATGKLLKRDLRLRFGGSTSAVSR